MRLTLHWANSTLDKLYTGLILPRANAEDTGQILQPSFALICFVSVFVVVCLVYLACSGLFLLFCLVYTVFNGCLFCLFSLIWFVLLCFVFSLSFPLRVARDFREETIV